MNLKIMKPIVYGEGLIAQMKNAPYHRTLTGKELKQAVEDTIKSLAKESRKPRKQYIHASLILSMPDDVFLMFCASDKIIIMSGINGIKAVEQRYEKLSNGE